MIPEQSQWIQSHIEAMDGKEGSVEVRFSQDGKVRVFTREVLHGATADDPRRWALGHLETAQRSGKAAWLEVHCAEGAIPRCVATYRHDQSEQVTPAGRDDDALAWADDEIRERQTRKGHVTLTFRTAKGAIRDLETATKRKPLTQSVTEG